MGVSSIPSFSYFGRKGEAVNPNDGGIGLEVKPGTLFFAREATNIFQERMISHVLLVRLTDKADRHIHFAVLDIVLGDDFFVLVMNTEDPVELSSGYRHVGVDRLGCKIDDRTSLALNQDGSDIYTVLVSSFHEELHDFIVILQLLIDTLDPIVSHLVRQSE